MQTLLKRIAAAGFVVLLSIAAGCSDDPTTPTIDDGDPGGGRIAPTTGFYVDQATGDDNNDGAIDRPFKTITAALAVADSADTIMVAPGTYGAGETFPLRLHKDMLLVGDEANKGDGAQKTRISGSGPGTITPGSSIVREITLVGAEGAQVRGFQFTRSDNLFGHFSIMMDNEIAAGASSMVVTNNTFIDVFGGIVSWKGSGMQITDNVFDTDYNGAAIIQSDQVVFDRNHVTCGRYGLDLPLNTGEAFARDNQFFVDTAGGSGIRTQSGLTHISNNEITQSIVGTPESAAVFALSGSSILRNNTFDTWRGILVWNSGAPDAGTPAEDGNNDFSRCEGPAIEHNSSGTASVYGNTFRNSTPVLGDDIIITGTGTVEGPYTVAFWVNPSTGDNNNNNGSKNQPFRTITHALSTADGVAPELHLAVGTYSAEETFPLVMPAGTKIIGASTDSFGRDLQIVGEGAYEIGSFDGATMIALGDIEMERVSVRGSGSNPLFYFGLMIDSGAAKIRNCEFGDAYGGVYADFDVTQLDLDAVQAINGSYSVYSMKADYSGCYLTASIPYNARSGSIFNSVITITNYYGAAQTGGSVEVTSCAFRYSAPAGSPDMSYGGIIVSFGSPVIRNCTFETPVGVFIRSDGQVDLGRTGAPGNNDFTATTTGIRHTGTETIPAIGNTWPHNPPQVGSDIVLESTGTVDTGITN